MILESLAGGSTHHNALIDAIATATTTHAVARFVTTSKISQSAPLDASISPASPKIADRLPRETNQSFSPWRNKSRWKATGAISSAVDATADTTTARYTPVATLSSS